TGGSRFTRRSRRALERRAACPSRARAGRARRSEVAAAFGERAREALGDERAFEDHAGVDLDEARAGVDLGDGGIGIGDAADADDRELAAGGLGDVGDDPRGDVADGPAAEAAGLVD